MNYILELFGNIPLSTAIIFLAAIGFLIGSWYKLYKKIVEDHDKRQEKDEMLTQISIDINQLKTSNEEIVNSINELVKDQKALSDRQEEIEKQNRTRNTNEIRDRLLQSYRYYTDDSINPKHAWTEMEKEAFDKMFADYESLGGDGFMHSNVYPAMISLNVIPMSDLEGLTDLMKSRKG